MIDTDEQLLSHYQQTGDKAAYHALRERYDRALRKYLVKLFCRLQPRLTVSHSFGFAVPIGVSSTRCGPCASCPARALGLGCTLRQVVR